MKTSRTSPNAFSLVELLVVIAITSVLLSMLIPSLSAAREHAKTLQCVNNVRQISTGDAFYQLDNKQWFTGGWNYADAINAYIGTDPKFLQQAPGGTYAYDAKAGYPFKCPNVYKTYGLPINVGGIERKMTCVDYSRNSALHGTELRDANEPNGSFRWRRSHQLVSSPARVLDFADGAGSMRIDYSQFGMINRHNNQWSATLTFVDGHAIIWRLRSTTRSDMNGGYGNYDWN
jgi:prepilin-type N-terminal cleavage/methylation domain-containing protein/prepilin-type processing-associated H-X9-DG protein